MGLFMDRLDALAAFVRIVELGSFTAAAADLGRRQATISRWIAQLEDTLQLQLLDRTTRTVAVTDGGQRFYRQARAVLSTWSDAMAEVSADREALIGRIRVSVPVVFGARFVSPGLPGFMARHPHLEVELSFSDRYVDLVRSGVDVALRVGRPIDTEYRARTLGDTARRLVASPGYLAARGAPNAPADLRAHACLVHSGVDPRVTWRLTRGEQTERITVGGRLRVDHSETIRQVAVADGGVALLAGWLVDDDIAAGRLIRLLPEWRPPRAPIQALFASTRHPPRAVRAFMDFLTDALAPALCSPLDGRRDQ